MKKFLLVLTLAILFVSSIGQAQDYDFKNTIYYYKLPSDSLISSGLNLSSFNFSNASATDSIFNGGIYFPALDCFGRNLWIRLRHVAADPNGTSVGINVPATTSNPCQSNIMIGGWAGFLYDFEIYRDLNLTGNRSYFLGTLYPTSITVASLETLSGTCGSSEWLSFVILNTLSTGWELNAINFTGNNTNSNPAFSDTLAVYTTGGCFPPDGFSYTFPTGSDSISAINANSQSGYTEFKMSAGSVSHFQYGYEFAGLSGGYQGMSMAFGSPPSFVATSTDVTCMNGNNGQINVIISGGIGPFTYQWSNGNTTGDTLGGLMPGTYTLTVTDQNGCGTLADTTLTINQPVSTVILDSTAANNVSCFNGNDGSIQLYAVGSGVLSYNWNTGSAVNLVSNLIAGVYICTISDQSTCRVTYDTITQPAAIDTSTSLNGNTITAHATGAGYQWINCNGNVPIAGSTGVSFTPSVSGSYKVAITKNGCTDTSACVNIIIIGINEVQTMVVSVFPNPGTEVVNLLFAKPVLNAKLKMINAIGQVVTEKNNISGPSYTLNIAEQATGIYTIEINSNENISRIKMVKE